MAFWVDPSILCMPHRSIEQKRRLAHAAYRYAAAAGPVQMVPTEFSMWSILTDYMGRFRCRGRCCVRPSYRMGPTKRRRARIPRPNPNPSSSGARIECSPNRLFKGYGDACIHSFDRGAATRLPASIHPTPYPATPCIPQPPARSTPSSARRTQGRPGPADRSIPMRRVYIADADADATHAERQQMTVTPSHIHKQRLAMDGRGQQQPPPQDEGPVGAGIDGGDVSSLLYVHVSVWGSRSICPTSQARPVPHIDVRRTHQPAPTAHPCRRPGAGGTPAGPRQQGEPRRPPFPPRRWCRPRPSTR